LISFDSNIVLDKLKKPKKYINNDESSPLSFFAKLIEILFECENRLVISYVIIFIIVGIKIIRFLMNDFIYFDYMIGKLNIVISLIVIYRANVKVYIDYKVV
jgi:hypothetical protein